jgi:hypothetical protein
VAQAFVVSFAIGAAATALMERNVLLCATALVSRAVTVVISESCG